jgi:hypothetical protein
MATAAMATAAVATAVMATVVEVILRLHTEAGSGTRAIKTVWSRPPDRG